MKIVAHNEVKIVLPGYWLCNEFIKAGAEDKLEHMVRLMCKKVTIDIGGQEKQETKSYFLDDIETLAKNDE